MEGKLTRFRIDGLHGFRTIDVPFVDNRLILVGENGSGKSTFASFVYFFVTQQWQRMLDFEFNSIEAEIDDQKILLTRDEIESISSHRSVPDRIAKLPLSYQRRLEGLFRDYENSGRALSVEDFVRQSRPSSLPLSVVYEYFGFRLQATVEESKTLPEYYSSFLRVILNSPLSQVLYLPTYRRIEQDLQSVLPDLDAESIRSLRERFARRGRALKYVELVEFGMEDVSGTIDAKMLEIKDDVRSGLNTLTGTYLRDVIRGDYRNLDLAGLRVLDEPTVDALFSQIDEATLPKPEQESLRGLIRRIQAGEELQTHELVIAHFLTKLIELHEVQKGKERDVRDFVEVCNRYLSGKDLVYDNVEFKVTVHQPSGSRLNTSAEIGEPETIELKTLSSGEKQIVSLFSHIYLSGRTGYFVIIDEPELSLSVTWQKRFLEDILNTGRMNGLIAVTHSPFVYDNELKVYAHSIEEFVSPK